MNRRLLLISMTAAVMAVGFVVILDSALRAQDCRVIRIQGMAMHQSVRAEPEVMSISKGTCVIWFNRASANEIKIVFKEGKRCSSVTEAPVGFSLDHEQCFVTSWIAFGGISSLRFKEAGTYEYAIEVTTGETPEKGIKASMGTIIVR